MEAFEKLKESEDDNFSTDGSTSINWHWNPYDFKKYGTPGQEPPTLFEFDIGERPRLPVFGRHFQNCSSKISFCADYNGEREGEVVENVIKKIF